MAAAGHQRCQIAWHVLNLQTKTVTSQPFQTALTTTVTFTCSDGYVLRNSGLTSTNVTCGTSGAWSDIPVCESDSGSEGEGGGSSLLAALIAVSVISIIIIAVLSVLLAYFYCKNTIKQSNEQYSLKTFPNPVDEMTTSMASFNQQQVTEEGVVCPRPLQQSNNQECLDSNYVGAAP
ncbi:uncharacterized protein LOC128226959 [Mya arenaria]|uniref:uncharacterized protein LOC128226959 n=1 Tax=Mya arenaria TaxID=6604 RepID=UPI0022E1ADDE|nr:uncharacterized protein LOC128226959 [Mya arenaria]